MSLARLHKKRRHGMHSDGYWPGYVDALINVVLNLMFLVSILAVGSFSMVIEISRKVLMPAMQASVEKVTHIVDDVRTTGTEGALITINVVESATPKELQAVSIDRVRTIESQTLMQVKFAAGALQLNDSTRADLIPHLRDLLQKNPGASLAVWAVSDADPQSRRASFMRVMALRDALKLAGAENNNVVTRILPGTNTRTDGQLVYVLVRSIQSRKEADEQ